jgi:hypothetical protein
MADEKDPLEEMQHTPLLVLPDKVHKQLTAWLRAYIPTLRMNRDKNDNIKDRIATWHSTLRGVRRVPPFRRGVSNLSTPLTLWASAAIRARIRQAVLESKPVLAALPLKSASDSGVDLNRLATAYSRVFQAEFDSPNGLDGATAVEKAINEVVNLGTAGIKVYEEITPPCYVLDANGVPTLVPSKSRVKWDFIAFQDLIYVDGYGDDTQAMPLCGHEYDITWGEMEIWRAAKQFYPNVLDRVKAHYNPGHTTMASLPYDDMPAKLKTHRVAELHLRYCIDDPDARDYTGYPTALVLTWHVEAGELLRCVRSPIPGGIKPIFLARLDDEPDPTKARGQGVCEKLEGAQEETDVIHNLGIEAAKRATAHAVMIKEGSNAAKEFGDAGMSVNPGDVAVTEDPKEDLVLKPLGDPRGSEVALMQEGNTKQYVFRILGLDEGSFGQVETGKRVPASLGISIQREAAPSSSTRSRVSPRHSSKGRI